MNPNPQIGNFDNPHGARVLHDVVFDLHKEIAYYLAQEGRDDFLASAALPLLAAVDLLALMAERCAVTPRVSEGVVRRWRDRFLSAYDRESDGIIPIGQDKYRETILETFAHLEAMAVLHPPAFWENLEKS